MLQGRKNNPTHVRLFLLLRFGSIRRGRRSFAFDRDESPIGFGLSELAWNGFAAASVLNSSESPLLLLLLISRLSDFDDHSAAIEFLLIQELDCLLRGFCAGQRNEPVARRTCSSKDHFSTETERIVSTCCGGM